MINYKIADNFFTGTSVGMAGTTTSFSTWINSLGQEMILYVLLYFHSHLHFLLASLLNFNLCASAWSICFLRYV